MTYRPLGGHINTSHGRTFVLFFTLLMATNPQIVGQSPLRKEGAAKVLGRAQYVDDITLPDMWFGATVRSTIPHGRISSISFGPGIPWDEFTIVSATDIPGENTIVHLTKDHPCLAVTNVNHV